MRVRLRRRGLVPALAVASAGCALSGCARAPAFNVLGSFFPGWIACAAVGILLSTAVHFALQRFDLERHIRLLPILYLSLATLFSSLLWLLFFE